MRHELFYKENEKYSKFLESQDLESFRKYTDKIKKLLGSAGATYLEVGCGTGISLSQLVGCGIETKGVDVSLTSVEMARSKGLDCIVYDGRKLPFDDSTFDAVGSIDVLEHTDDPVNFLDESLRVLKKGGYMIVVCPNFLSVTNGYHHHTAGIIQKIKNLCTIIYKHLNRKVSFKKMKTIEREVFQSDDDACNVTNPLDILRWAKSNDLKVKYWSGRTVYSSGFSEQLDRPLLRVFLGSSFFVFVK